MNTLRPAWKSWWGASVDLKRNYSDEFNHSFIGEIILGSKTEYKIHLKHKVYRDDIEDALGDPYRVVIKPRQKSKAAINKIYSSGLLFEIYCQHSNSQVLFIVARLFDDGNLYIITAYWADQDLTQFYDEESEVFKDG